MSLDYDFKIETARTTKEVLQIAAKANEVGIIEEKQSPAFRVGGTFAVASATDFMSEPAKQMWREAYTFVPTVSLTFEFYQREDPEWKHTGIKRSIAALFQRLDGKAVLLWNGEKTIAQRTAGELLIQEDDYDWLTEEFDRVGLKYKRAQLESPLL